MPQYSATCGAAVEAEKATKDGSGNVITTTYATKAQLSDGSVTKIGTSTVGSASKPIYLNEGVPTEGTYTLGAACAKSVSDSSSASALSSTDINVPTVRDIYYGLPKFNNGHDYTSDKSFYAPTSAGTSGYFLKSNGSGAPTWVDLPGTWTLSNTGIWLSENLSNSQTGHVILRHTILLSILELPKQIQIRASANRLIVFYLPLLQQTTPQTIYHREVT